MRDSIWVFGGPFAKKSLYGPEMRWNCATIRGGLWASRTSSPHPNFIINFFSGQVLLAGRRRRSDSSSARTSPQNILIFIMPAWNYQGRNPKKTHRNRVTIQMCITCGVISCQRKYARRFKRAQMQAPSAYLPVQRRCYDFQTILVMIFTLVIHFYFPLPEST